MFEIMTEENYIMYALKSYENPGCQSVDEFREDLNRVKYVKRLLNRYTKTGVLKERLILNHLIIFCNTFGNEAAIRMLFFKLDERLYSALKTFLVFLNIMPVYIYGIKNKMVYCSDIQIDFIIANTLREI